MLQNRRKVELYLGLYQTFIMKLLRYRKRLKIVLTIFAKKLHHRFWWDPNGVIL